MPPRIPLVLVFVAAYLAVAFGVGADAPDRVALALAPGTFDTPELRDQLTPLLVGLGVDPEPVFRFGFALSLAETLALAAALAALPDAAWRPARRGADRLMSMVAALVAVGAVIVEPDILSAGYAVLTALVLGDLIGALGVRRRPADAAA